MEQLKKKKKQKNYLSILFVSLLSLLTSCAVTPPDVPLCTEIHPSKGYCINTISSKEYEVSDLKPLNGKTWWELRPLMIYMPADSWKELKKFIIKVCKASNKCKNEHVSSWERTVKSIDQKIAP